MKDKRLYVTIIIFIQGVIIFVLFYHLGRAHTTTHIAPINKNSIVFSKDSPTKNFYEPKANTIIKNPPQYFSLPYLPTYTINNDNLNERYNYSVEKKGNTVRIITLGDSYTFGHFVNTKDNWPETLEDLLKIKCSNDTKYEVINLAERGYDISYSVERFKKRGIKYNPDIVLWLIKFDDFDEINDIVHPLSKYYENEMKKKSMLDELFKKGEIYPYTERAKREFSSMYTKKQILTFQKSFLEDFINSYKNTLIFIPLNLDKDQINVLSEVTLDKSVTFITPHLPSFQKLPDNHPTREGHKTIAHYIFTYMVENNILSCR